MCPGVSSTQYISLCETRYSQEPREKSFGPYLYNRDLVDFWTCSFSHAGSNEMRPMPLKNDLGVKGVYKYIDSRVDALPAYQAISDHMPSFYTRQAAKGNFTYVSKWFVQKL